MVGKIFKVIFSRNSIKKLRGISDYLTENFSSSSAAHVTGEIRREAARLEKLPGSKPRYPGTEDLDEDIRYTKKWSYKIIFEVLDPKKIVRILTIRHDAEDPEDILDEIR